MDEIEKVTRTRGAGGVEDSTLGGYTPTGRVFEDTIVVDVDVHISEMPGALAPYCDMPWRVSLEHLDSVWEHHTGPGIPGFGPLMQTETQLPGGLGGGRRNVARDAAEMRRDLDDLGIDIGILFPGHLLHMAYLSEAAYAVALARAYNRWLVDEWLAGDEGLKGAIIAVNHDPLAAAEEIRRWASHRNVVAVYLPTACVDPLWGDRRYDPVFDAAQETGLPVFLHSSIAMHPVFPFNLHGFETQFAKHCLSHFFSLTANLVKMLETGVPVRFPKLKIAFTEGGVGWVPALMFRLDREFTPGITSHRREVPWLTERPSHYIKQMFFATQPIEEPDRMQDLAALIEMMDGENSVVFASDWPHADFDHPRKIAQIPLPGETLRNILGRNALRLLNIEAPAKRSAVGNAL